MSKRKKNDLVMPATWRNLKPRFSRKSSSQVVVKKRWAQVGRLFLGTVVIILFISFFFLQNEKKAQTEVGQKDYTGPSLSINQIIFRSSGPLNKEWFLNWLGPLRGSSLVEIDLEKLHQNLLKEDQISSARIKRSFPSTLEIEIKERVPMLVLRLRNGKNGYLDWLVSSDGTLYRGVGYSRGMLKLIPSLKIASSLIEKTTDEKAFKKLKGIPIVAPLLELARRDFPELYRGWSVVAYNRPYDRDPGANITIKSNRVKSIRFQPSNYADQLKRLSYLLDEPNFSQAATIHSIDLSHGHSVFAKI
jgi:hypothetical protein